MMVMTMNRRRIRHTALLPIISLLLLASALQREGEIVMKHQGFPSLSSILDVHLRAPSVLDAILVAINDTDATSNTTSTTSCPPISHLFPEDTVLLNKREQSITTDTRLRASPPSIANTRATTAVIVVFDLQAQKVCEWQRRHLVVSSDAMRNENDFRIVSFCRGCQEAALPLVIDEPSPASLNVIKRSFFVIDEWNWKSKDTLVGNDWSVSDYLIHADSMNLNRDVTIFVHGTQGHWHLKVNPVKNAPSVTYRHLESDFGIGITESSKNAERNHNPQTKTSSRLPISTVDFDDMSEQENDSLHTIGSNVVDDRQSNSIGNNNDDRCLVPFHECCEDKDCLFAGEICVHRNCIDDGHLRITLKWFGDDDLDLYVITPEGAELSYRNDFDQLSLGRFGEDTDQLGSGYHVENVYFRSQGAPAGKYYFYVRPLITVETSDQWTVDVVVDGTVVLSNSGYGASPDFQYDRQQQVPTPNPSVSSPGQSPTRPPLGSPLESQPTFPPEPPHAGLPSTPPQNVDDCSLFSNECCVDDDCVVSTNMCIQRTCISDGNPRITLIYEGDDDLNLFVRTPSGVKISAENAFDQISLGRHEQDVDQSFVRPHVENIYFPFLGAPTGDYEYGVQLISQRGVLDPWLIEIYEGGTLMETKSGLGDSATFTYFRSEGIQGPERPLPTPPDCISSEKDCCKSSDCEATQICVQRLCINEGSPRVTLEWIGDDDYNLFVETPAGVLISKNSTFDPQTGGRFGETPSQVSFDFQLEYVYFPSPETPLGTYHVFVESSATRGVGADVWKIGIYEFGQLVQEESGIGDSRRYTYQRVVLPTPPTFPSSSPESPATLPTEAPDIAAPSLSSSTGRICPLEFECCETTDCAEDASICVQRTCITRGAFAIDLTWTGNDSISLVVMTPLQDTISAQTPVDQVSGGLFQNDQYQPGFGFHVETVVFPTAPPSGTYTFFVKSVMVVGEEDRWTVKVYDSNQLASFTIGTGDSRTLTYEYQQGLLPSNPPFASPSIAPIPLAIPTPVPPVVAPTECGSEICEAGIQACVQEVCIMEGNPRISLQWTGNDDLGLVVVTPDGTSISADLEFDPISGGRFEETGDVGMQEGFGKHLESIFFPRTGSPVGVYQCYVTAPRAQGSDDSWILTVAVGGVDVETWQGSGISDIFVFRYLGGIDPPGPHPGGCTVSTECGPGQLCIEKTCIDQGTPQIVLTYTGDDDLDLYVITPIGTTIFSQNKDDVPSGGKFGDNGSGEGVQDAPGSHVEYVYFVPNGPMGIYQFYVETFRSTDDDDQWTISVYVSGQIVSVESGFGSSEVFVFDFNSTSMPAIPPTPPPSDNFCDDVAAECCSDDACFPNEACTFLTCVDEGNPRFTLSWEGENDLDLLVQTPLNTVISFSNDEDAASGGKFGEEFDQFAFGKHVENIYFPMKGGPLGEYSIFVRSFLSDGMDDEYTIRVYVNGLQEFSFSGSGDSVGLSYVFEGLPATPSISPVTEVPTIGPPIDLTPTNAPQIEDCNEEIDECCSDTQCMMGVEVCTQRTCIDIGFLRFTLEWVGDDDLDLFVQTPAGTIVSFPNPIDEETGGIFGEGGTQIIFGTHVENVYFPSPSIPTGGYLYNVSSFEKRGAGDDEWSVSVFLNNTLVDSRAGRGDSETYTFIFEEGEVDGPPPDSDCDPLSVECCVDDECISGQVCTFLNFCINKGSPRFTLEYVGDDQIDLTVVTPVGTTVSLSNPDDGVSTGRFEDKGDGQVGGKRVQNVYFAEGPVGTYTYFVSTFDLNGEADEWTIKVFEDDAETVIYTGSGNADFLYEFDLTSTTPPTPGNTPSPTIPSGPNQSLSPVGGCQTPGNECCADEDCESGSVCRSQICIMDGSPRFTLTWSGSHVYDLSVTAPTGGMISFVNQFDEESGGRFVENVAQTIDGLRVKNIFFPREGGPFGSYTAKIAASDNSTSVNPTTWALEIAVGGVIAESKVGNGTSAPINFEYQNESRNRFTGKSYFASVTSESVEWSCISDVDCTLEGAFCSSKACIAKGSLGFTLTWTGDLGIADDLDLVIVTPEGKLVQNGRRQGVHFSDETPVSQSRSSPIFGTQVKSVSFSTNPVNGMYKYQVKSFAAWGGEDQWIVQVFVDGEPASKPFVGNGTSDFFFFDYEGTTQSMESPDGGSVQHLNTSSADSDVFDHNSLHDSGVHGIGNGNGTR